MTANLTLLIVIGVLVACGVYLILERAVSKMLLGLILFGNAVNLLILTAGGGDGAAPIRGRPPPRRWPTRSLRRWCSPPS